MFTHRLAYAGLAATLTLTAAVLHPLAPAAVGPAAPYTLLRDQRAAVDTLGSPAQPATPTDYIQPDTQVEPSIAVNPQNPLNAVAGFQEGRVDAGGDATNGYATTFDGGRTWVHGEWPGLTSVPGQGGVFDRASDAVVAFGPDNTVYASSLVFDDTSDQGLRSGMAVNVSRDGGRTWSAPVVFQDEDLGGTNDKNWVVVDRSNAPGHHQGRVYVVWDRVAPVVYDYCDHDCDQLGNWLPNLQTVPMPIYAGQGIGAFPVVLADGSLGVIFSSQTGGVPAGLADGEPDVAPASGSIDFVEAPSAGSVPWPAPLVWLPPVGVASQQNNAVRTQRAGSLPAAAVDPQTGTIYAGWEDGRFRSDGVNDAVISSSTDGVHWTPPVRVDGGPTGDYLDRYNVMLDVAPDGRLVVGYRQRQEAATGVLFSRTVDTAVQVSSDHGATFGPPLVIDAPQSDVYHAAFSRAGIFEGDYNQLACAGTVCYVARDEAFAAHPGEPAALTPNPDGSQTLVLADSGKGHQHQNTWVAVLGPAAQPAAAPPAPAVTPAGGTQGITALADTGAVPATGVAVAAGAAVTVTAAVAGRRRRRPAASRAPTAPHLRRPPGG